MPVINCKAGPATDNEKGVYICPTYCTPGRRPYFVFAAQLRATSRNSHSVEQCTASQYCSLP